MLRRTAFLFSSLFFAVGCNSSTKVLSVDEAEKVKVGKEFEVRMKSNPSTGFKWMWVNRGLAAADSVDFKFVTGEQKSPIMCGAGGTEVWTFKAKKTGADSLKFYYVRPWEKENVVDSLVFHFNLK